MRRVVVCLLALLAIALSAAAPTPARASTSGRHVCLDPGHGGSDPGAVYAGMQEKDLTLQIAQQTAAALTSDGAIVTLTRTGDAALGNSERAAICNAASAEIVVSIHLNASSNSSADYAQVFYGKRIKDLAFAKAIDGAYRPTVPGGTEPLPHAAVTNFANGTLLHANGPAALVETVFLSNPAEQTVLAAGTRQQEIAQQLYGAISSWLTAH